MFWDSVSGVYDIFMELGNKRVNTELCSKVAALIEPDDRVLECACGTGMLSMHIAGKCRTLTATDFSKGMLARAAKKCRTFSNTVIEFADISFLKYETGSFDKVVAANVIHLLDEPEFALKELARVCRPDGSIIIPTYISERTDGEKMRFAIRLVEKLGAGFKRQFDYKSYQSFFKDRGYEDCEFDLIEGKTPCAIAIIKNRRSGSDRYITARDIKAHKQINAAQE